MKHAIGFPSVRTGRQVRWTFELSAVREEIPQADGSAVKSAPAVARPVRRSRRIALATAVAGLIAVFALARYFASGDEYDPADAFFTTEAATADRGGIVEPIASAPATHSAPAAATPAASPATVPVMAGVHPIAARKTVAETAGTLPGKKPVDVAPARKPVDSTQGKKTVVEAAAATIVAAPAAVDAREAEKSTAAVVHTEAADSAPAPAIPVTTASDEVTITGCLDIDADHFRLTDTEGANAPKSRSWRSGFFRKRAATVDLVGSIDALSLHPQIGQRIAATGVLTSRTLKVSSMRTVSPACN